MLSEVRIKKAMIEPILLIPIQERYYIIKLYCLKLLSFDNHI